MKPFTSKTSLVVSIKTSLVVAVVFLLLTLAGISILATVRLNALEQTIDTIGSHRLPLIRALGEIELNVTRIRLSAVKLALSRLDTSRAANEKNLVERQEKLAEQITAFEGAIRPNAAQMLLFTQFTTNWLSYVGFQNAMLQAAKSGDDALTEQRVNVESFAAYNRVAQALDNCIMLINGAADDEIAAAASDSALFSSILWVMNGLSLLVGLGTLAFVVREVSMPIRRITESMALIARGELATEIPYVERNNELGLMARALMVFRKSLTENDRLSAATRTLSELSEWLQSAKSEGELYDMLADVLARLMPECRGSLYIYANSRDALEVVKDWNGEQAILQMHPDECWGLRKGHTYCHGTREIEFRCDHVTDATPDDYCCIPILAHGETVGLLHLEYLAGAEETRDEIKARFADRSRLGQACAEHISIAIANVKLREELRDQTVRDVLTGLNNRRYLLEAARLELQRSSRQRTPISILSIDVDHFKTFNDNHGHDAGDTVLRSVGECMRAVAKDDEVPCRYGGEEFIMLLPDTDAAKALARAEELRAKIAALIVRYGNENLPRITISIGVATYPSHGETLMDLIKSADVALYAAKRNGRNRVELARTTQADAPLAADAGTEERLDQALIAADQAARTDVAELSPEALSA